MNPDIQQISAQQTYVVRVPMLRPGLPASDSCFPGDDALDALHFGAMSDGQVLGTASFFREDHPSFDRPGSYRLRGMAVLESHQDSGLGTALLSAGLETLRKNAVPLVWCNARKAAANFYQHRGFEIIGEEFDIPGIGLHVLMATEFRA